MSFFDFFKKKTLPPSDALAPDDEIPDLVEATPNAGSQFIDAAGLADLKERPEDIKSKRATVEECEPSTDAFRIQEQQYEERDPLFMDAVDAVVETETTSVSMLQRKLKLGYSRAAHLIDQMEAVELVGPYEGAKPRKVLVSKERWEEMKSEKEILTIPVKPIQEDSPAAYLRRTAQADLETAKKVDDVVNIQKISALADYKLPDIQILRPPIPTPQENVDFCSTMEALLNDTLDAFHLPNRIVRTKQGPRFTHFEAELVPGQRLNTLTRERDNISCAIGREIVQIQPVLGVRSTVFFEIENPQFVPVSLRKVLETDSLQSHPSSLAFALGEDMTGDNVICDLAKCSHLLIGGVTGTGKTVCLDAILLSLLFRAKPADVNLILIDFSSTALEYQIPHLLVPPITDRTHTNGALNWVASEMQRRYTLLAGSKKREIGSYNDLQWEQFAPELARIVVIIDGLEQLFAGQHGKTVEDAQSVLLNILRSGQTVGIHLVATAQALAARSIPQAIKAAFPSKICFATVNSEQSRAFLDFGGAEHLTGPGDMLYRPQFALRPVRVQGCMVSPEEVQAVVKYVQKAVEGVK